MKKRIFLLCFLLVLLISISGCGYDPRNNPLSYPNEPYTIAELYLPLAIIEPEDSVTFNFTKLVSGGTDIYGRRLYGMQYLVRDNNGIEKSIYAYIISKEGEIRYTYHMTKNWIRYSEYELNEEEIQQYKEDNCWNEPIENNPKMMLYDDYYDGVKFISPEASADDYEYEYSKMKNEINAEDYYRKYMGYSNRKGIFIYEGMAVVFYFRSEPFEIIYDVVYSSEIENLAEYSQYLADEYFATWEGYVVQD